MPLLSLAFTLASTNRAAIRTEVFDYWIKEAPGTPSVTNSYHYLVETLSDGSEIYLARPTRLNKGADFKILCRKHALFHFKNGNDRPPNHEGLFAKFKSLITSLAGKTELLTALRRIWDCENSAAVVSSLVLFRGNVRAERALLLAKWFFIEQDVTYWTQSGRHMLRGAFEERFGPLP